jgi:hypothetical protein
MFDRTPQGSESLHTWISDDIFFYISIFISIGVTLYIFSKIFRVKSLPIAFLCMLIPWLGTFVIRLTDGLGGFLFLLCTFLSACCLFYTYVFNSLESR